MANTASTNKKTPQPTFEVRFKGPDVDLAEVPFRAVSDALGAIQDIASGRDPFESQRVPPEKALGLVKVRRGSAIYSCYSHSPAEAICNLGRAAQLLSFDGSSSNGDDHEDGFVTLLKPVESLSSVARQVQCQIEVRIIGDRKPILVVTRSDYDEVSKRVLLTGETTVTGSVERVGGATALRCLLRVPGRRRILYCSVTGKKLARELGQHLYETVVATGTATWIHRSWRIYAFTIAAFSKPTGIGEVNETIAELRKAGLAAWDDVDDPAALLREIKS